MAHFPQYRLPLVCLGSFLQLFLHTQTHSDTPPPFGFQPLECCQRNCDSGLRIPIWKVQGPSGPGLIIAKSLYIYLIESRFRMLATTKQTQYSVYKNITGLGTFRGTCIGWHLHRQEKYEVKTSLRQTVHSVDKVKLEEWQNSWVTRSRNTTISLAVTPK